MFVGEYADGGWWKNGPAPVKAVCFEGGGLGGEDGVWGSFWALGEPEAEKEGILRDRYKKKKEARW